MALIRALSLEVNMSESPNTPDPTAKETQKTAALDKEESLLTAVVASYETKLNELSKAVDNLKKAHKDLKREKIKDFFTAKESPRRRSTNQEPRRKQTGYESRFTPEPQGSDCKIQVSPQSGGEYNPYSTEVESKAHEACNRFREIVKDILLIRDQIEQILQFDKRSVAQADIETIKQLDKFLEKEAKTIRARAGLEDLKKLLQPKSQGWWWNPPHPWDEYDWLWKFLSIVLVAATLVFTVNLVPRFWAGGPSIPGAAVAVIPGLLTLLFSKDFWKSLFQTENH